uniref:Tyrosine-protein kinase receptor TYRO3 n=1 Tax=Cyprinus carpio TaxID=7962 RepID=A0A8C1FYC0_CYPCA
NMARLGCAFEGLSEPEIIWIKDGEKIYSTDQIVCSECFFLFSVKSVQQQDAGKYWCEVEYHGRIISSEPAWITVEGVPHFVVEPKDVAAFAGEPFNLTCAASGPPEPVEVLWWLGGEQKGDFTPSPSVLFIKGETHQGSVSIHTFAVFALDHLSSYMTYLQYLPQIFKWDVKVHHVSDLNITLTWSPGFTGHSQLSTCTIQVSKGPGKKVKLPDVDVVVPPFQHVFEGLSSYSNYSVRIRCDNEVGSSPFSPWVGFHTPEAGITLRDFFLCVAHYAGMGWLQALLSRSGAQTQRGHLWVGLLFGLLVATMVGLLLIVLVRNRGKETQFGSAFAASGTDVPVSFTAARSFNRQFPEPPESTLDSLGINSDLKAKLQDVLISERLLTLGRMLGKGEFGSVREAFLKSENNSGQKVAVKVLKTDINSSSDIEQCLKEAAYMKDFHHPNVIKLIGVSLHRRAQQRLPVPMVILPFMKHGDLHTYLLMSRFGDEPFTLSQQILIQFMLDIARGMEYLSSKNIIHRDLAARNCMLNENMSVCVADFGLSKKIYSGDYYRQGSVSKLPVKWIALESLADNVYTTQSDVWAFGVTMWEIMTRGQTPYPGVENSEIYEYLIKGERLKQPPDCPADIYEIMHSCWSPVPKCRPSFQHLIDQLELLWAKMNPAPVKEPLLYVNLEEEDGEQASGPVADAGTRSSEEPSWGVPWQCVGIKEDEKDWLMVSSGAALAIGGDYRYIIGPHGSVIDEESRHSDDGLGMTWMYNQLLIPFRNMI